MKKNIRKKIRLFRAPMSLIHSLGNSLRVLPGSLRVLPGLLCAFMSFVFLLSGTAQADWVKGESKNAWWFDFGNGAWTVSNIVQTKPSDLIPKNNTNNSVNTVSNTFTETQNNNLAETRSYEENQSNEDFNEKQDEYRADLLRRVNKYRDRQGLNTLEENDYLNEMAQIRAEELSVRFSHIRPNGELADGYGLDGEIIVDTVKTPREAFLAFKSSKQHNEIMLRKDILTFGSGYYVDGNGKSYWIVLFSTHPQPENLRQQ